jgi:hypothetical protein
MPITLEHEHLLLGGAVATAGGNHAVSPRRYKLRDSPLKAEARVRIRASSEG